MPRDITDIHVDQVKRLKALLSNNKDSFTIKKKSVSNLFRYEGRNSNNARKIDLSDFNKVLFIDKEKLTADVQGLTTYETLVDETLHHGLLPLVAPELKHITVGGATVGIGIETNSYKYGFVHDGLIEAEVLLPDGQIVICNANNKYSDLFHGLPNSYGTLGYILRAKIKLRPAKKYVQLKSEQYTDLRLFISAMEKSVNDKNVDYIESLVYSSQKFYLITSRQTDEINNLKSIYGNNIFYKELSHPHVMTLTTKEYIFRYDPEWFWAIPETPFYELFRTFAPGKIRNSAFYARYVNWQRNINKILPFINFEDPNLEQLIQDWEVPWKNAFSLLNFALENLDLSGRPIMAVPIKTKFDASFYPIKTNQLYLNLGSYSYVAKKSKTKPYLSTKIMDDYCFDHKGIKMLYSSTFMDKKTFNSIYNGKEYTHLKNKYDPSSLTPTLYDKAVKSR